MYFAICKDGVCVHPSLDFLCTKLSQFCGVSFTGISRQKYELRVFLCLTTPQCGNLISYDLSGLK